MYGERVSTLAPEITAHLCISGLEKGIHISYIKTMEQFIRTFSFRESIKKKLLRTLLLVIRNI